jgi:crotonobetainyl-CoA:carnitine CoA-transferase CaiB-like acyl-CoA transferase
VPKNNLRPYEGLFVLDAGQGVAGPYCGMLLAALGADVVKLEPPEGDWSRGLSFRKDGQSVMSTTFNRGKRGVMLDLRDPAGRAEAGRLAARADVLIESFRPGVAARLGLSPAAAKPDAVCVSISGFGQDGPYGERPCTDSVAQAFGGLVALNEGSDGVPHRTGPVLSSDVVTGLHAFIAVQAALAQRALDRVPQRRLLDVSLMGGTANLLGFPIAEWAVLGQAPAALNTPAGSYRTACGAWLMIALVRQSEWVALVEAMDLPQLLADPRFADFPARAAHKADLLPVLRARFAEKTASAWMERLKARRLLVELVNSPLDWLADPHVQASGAVAHVNQPELGAVPFCAIPGLGHWTSPAPALGQHNGEILEG